jgi:hypothetical protein
MTSYQVLFRSTLVVAGFSALIPGHQTIATQELSNYTGSSLVVESSSAHQGSPQEAAPSIDETTKYIKAKMQENSNHLKDYTCSGPGGSYTLVTVESCLWKVVLTCDQGRGVEVQSFKLADLRPDTDGVRILKGDKFDEGWIFGVLTAHGRKLVRSESYDTAFAPYNKLQDGVFIHFRDQEIARRVGKAFGNAIRLCGGGKDDDKDPFK